MMCSRYSSRGFTLIEMILAVVVYGTLVLSISALLFLLLGARAKAHVAAEVEQSGIQVMHQMTQALRNAEAVTSPSAGSSSSTLTLEMYNAAVDPTVFDVSSSVLRVSEGSGSAVPLTTDLVTVSDLTFQNVSGSGTPGTVRVSFTLTAVNASGRQEYTYAKIFYASGTLRQP